MAKLNLFTVNNSVTYDTLFCLEAKSLLDACDWLPEKYTETHHVDVTYHTAKETREGWTVYKLPEQADEALAELAKQTADKTVDIDGEIFTYDADSVLYEGEEGEGLQFWFYHQLANPTDEQIIELILKRQSGF